MALSKETSNRFDSLVHSNQLFLATYIWIDSDYNDILRLKTRTLDFEPSKPEDLPLWDCAIAFATSYINTDIYIKPVRLFSDPFYSGRNKLVLCENLKHDKTIANENKRFKCTQTFKRLEKFTKTKPVFIIEQFYTMYDKNGVDKLDEIDTKVKKKLHYCSIGIDRVNGRNIAESHYKACLYAGIKIKSFSCEKEISEWKYEIGPCESFDLADQVFMSRFILHRVAEDFGICVKFDSNTTSKLYFSIQEKDFMLKSLGSVVMGLEKIDLKFGESLLLMNKQSNNGLSGVMKLNMPENKVELNEMMEKDLNLKNGQKSHFLNELLGSPTQKCESPSSKFNCFFELLISKSNSTYFDTYYLLDQLINCILNIINPNENENDDDDV